MSRLVWYGICLITSKMINQQILVLNNIFNLDLLFEINLKK